MRKRFDERVRLQIYLDAESLAAITRTARENGLTVVEWARGVLTSSVETPAPKARRPKPSTKPSSPTEPITEEVADVEYTTAKPAHHPRCTCAQCTAKPWPIASQTTPTD